MPETVTADDLKRIVRDAVYAAFRDVGLHVDDPDRLDQTRADLRFMRQLRTNVEGIAGKIGTAIVLTVVAGTLTLIGYGLKVWLGK